MKVIATVSEDQVLMLWDTERDVVIMNRSLGYLANPTAVKFSRDGEILMIGYSDGFLICLDCQITKGGHQSKGDEKFILPSLKVLDQFKD